MIGQQPEVKTIRDMSDVGIHHDYSRYRLTKSEKEVIGLVFNAKTDKEIALALGKSPRTVQHQLESVYRKLGVHTRMEAFRKLILSPARYAKSVGTSPFV